MCNFNKYIYCCYISISCLFYKFLLHIGKQTQIWEPLGRIKALGKKKEPAQLPSSFPGAKTEIIWRITASPLLYAHDSLQN